MPAAGDNQANELQRLRKEVDELKGGARKMK
jgi:hypothetical protein